MSRGRIIPIVLLALLVPAYITILSTVTAMNKRLPKGDEIDVVMPVPLLKITSLDFDGLMSDFLYLKALVFYGSTITGKQQRKVLDWEYERLYGILNASTELDPYFQDPYFFANGVLTWEAKRIREVNFLLEKGSRYREWDYWLPFFIGFNYFYFLGENDKAAEYMMSASKKPGADPFYGFFATRLAYKGNRTENAIIFIEKMLETTKDPTMRKDYEIRLKALTAIQFLEKGVVKFKEKTGKEPTNLNELKESEIIGRIPVDPYGGEFYIDKDGSIKTTSDLRMMKK